jgi:hypothetical protein
MWCSSAGAHCILSSSKVQQQVQTVTSQRKVRALVARFSTASAEASQTLTFDGNCVVRSFSTGHNSAG